MHSLASSVLHSLAGLYGPFTDLKRSATALTGLLVPIDAIYIRKLASCAAVPITCMIGDEIDKGVTMGRYPTL